MVTLYLTVVIISGQGYTLSEKEATSGQWGEFPKLSMS